MAEHEALLRRLYDAFNAREIDAVIDSLHPDVDWPNALEGGRVHGHVAVRDYWTHQFGLIDPRVEPEGFTIEPDGRVAVRVHQVVRDLEGNVRSDGYIEHVYTLHDGLIERMEIRAGLDTDQLHALVPLSAKLGIRLSAATPEVVRLHMDWQEDLCTAGGVLHGGALMSLADTAGAVCAFLNLPGDGAGTTTIESKTNLLAAIRSGTVTAESTPLHVGSNVIVVETELRRDDERLAAKTTQTQAVLRS